MKHQKPPQILRNPFDNQRVSIDIYEEHIAMIKKRIEELKKYYETISGIPNLSKSETLALKDIVRKNININLHLIKKQQIETIGELEVFCGKN